MGKGDRTPEPHARGDADRGAGPAGRARELLIDALGRQSAFWGLGRAPGEIYAALYLAEGPMSLGALSDAVGLTKGSVSVAVRPLEQLGMVHRTWKRGSRRVFFEAEGDFFRMAHHVLARRQKPEFDASFRLVEEAESLLSGAAGEAGADGAAEHALDRIRKLRAFYGQLDLLVGALLSMSPEDMAEGATLLTQVVRSMEEGGRIT